MVNHESRMLIDGARQQRGIKRTETFSAPTKETQ